MKFLVNSKYFAAQINTALKNKALGVGIENDVIVFFGEGDRVECHGTLLETSEAIDLDRIQWWRVMKFCRRIPEQPLKINISLGNIDVHNVMRFQP